jgi:hypothetical protein
MTTEQKVIKAKVGLLELAKQLGSVSQACKVMGLRGSPIGDPRDDASWTPADSRAAADAEGGLSLRARTGCGIRPGPPRKWLLVARAR